MTKSVHRQLGRPRIADEPLEQISVRLTPGEIARVAAIASKHEISRNEAFRAVLNHGLDEWKR